MTIDLKERVREVLGQGHLMSLGTMDDEGVWVADVVYIFDDNFNIYWMSSLRTRHSKSIELNGKAAGSITISNKGKEENFGLQFEGVAKRLENLDFDIAKKHLIKRNYPIPRKPINLLKEGTAWYMLKPTSMYLIDEKNFGFNRQKLEF